MELVIYIGYAGVALGILIALTPFFVLYWALRKKKEELSVVIALSFIGWGIDIFRQHALFFEKTGFLILSATSIFFLLFSGGLLVLHFKRFFIKRK